MQLIAPPALIVIDINSLYSQEVKEMDIFVIPEPAKLALEYDYFQPEDGQYYQGNASKSWSRIKATKLLIDFTEGTYLDVLRNEETMYVLVAKYWNINFEVITSIVDDPLDFQWKVTGSDGSSIFITPDNLV